MTMFIAAIVGSLLTLMAPNPDLNGDGYAEQLRITTSGIYIENVCEAVGQTTAE